MDPQSLSLLIQMLNQQQNPSTSISALATNTGANALSAPPSPPQTTPSGGMVPPQQAAPTAALPPAMVPQQQSSPITPPASNMLGAQPPIDNTGMLGSLPMTGMLSGSPMSQYNLAMSL